ncbi:hypothetical protein [Clostridium sp. DJ247]|uniref:hypothetical protein n=1 Tax=Clostridium sp. DJ247 TaxID=2726188 RepID=UPI001624E263|nr:hypothetical protein [Clostridium sp. DJ247]MBC2578895.1 hypothetical protein [Clostridium sp. DJ247]
MKNRIFNIDKYYKVVITLGMIVSILWILLVNTQPFSDFKYYYDLAVDIANGLPWGDTYTSVGYSIVLGGIFKVFGASLLKAKAFNVILIFVANICFLSVLNNLNIKDKEKKIIFTLFVFMPNNIFYNSIVGTEILFTTIMLFITAIYFGEVKYKYVIIGFLVGLNTMIKPFFIVFSFAIFLLELIKEKQLIIPLKNALIILFMCIIVISPWIYRNSKLMGQITYVSNNGGIVLYINNNSQNHKGRWMAAEDVENSLVKTEEYKQANMTEKNKMLSKAAKEWIKKHPREFFALGGKRLFNTYFVGDDVLYSTQGSSLDESTKALILYITSSIRNIIFVPAIIYILFYSILILIRIFKRSTDRLDKFSLYSVILFFMFTSVYFITEGQGRYAFPEIFIITYFFICFIKLMVYIYKELKL